MHTTRYKWSIERWHKLIETGLLEDEPVELLNGEIVRVSPEGVEHRKVNDRTADYLRELMRGQAKVYEAHPVTLDDSEPEPDIAIVQLPVSLYDDRHPLAEDIYWLIEVSDKTLQKDLEQKAVTYASQRIQEYWIIDLKNKKLIVHTYPKGNNYSQIIEYKKGVISPQAFPNISIELTEIL